MKIGIDVTMLVYTGSGVANYTYNLVKNLLLNNNANEYRLFYSSFRRPKNFYYLEEFKKLGAKVYDYRFPPSFLKLCWGKFHILPIEWLIGKVDVFFSSDFLRPPLLKGTRGVTTVHDLVWKIYPQYHEDWIVTSHEKKLEKTIRYQDTVIVDSQNTKQDLLRLYSQIGKNKIHVVYPGIGKEFKLKVKSQKSKEILKKYGIDEKDNYLLYVGAIEPRKNLELSIKVFNKLITDNQSLITHFLIAGRAGWKNESVFQLVKDLNLEDKVKFIGYVDDEDLPYLYSASSLTLYLSSYEGFGLPPLEALSCGAKVLVGDNSSLKETIDEKYRVKLNNLDTIVEKIIEILKDKTIVFNNKYSWNSSAEKFLKILENI